MGSKTSGAAFNALLQGVNGTGKNVMRSKRLQALFLRNYIRCACPLSFVQQVIQSAVHRKLGSGEFY